MISLIKFLLDPFNVFWLLLVISAVVWFLNRKEAARWLIAVTGVWFLIVSTPLIPIVLVNFLEDRYEPLYIEELADTDAEYHIIVLGGGHGFDDRLPPNSLLSQQALARLGEGIRLHRQLPNSRLVLSGYSSSGRTTQAEMLQMTAVLLGVDKEKTIIQAEPGNTFQEARVYSEKFGTSHPVILVTSAIHMPRAVIMFEKFGIEPLPSPADYRLKGSWKRKRFGLPSTNNMEHFRAAMNEYAGIIQATTISDSVGVELRDPVCIGTSLE